MSKTKFTKIPESAKIEVQWVCSKTGKQSKFLTQEHLATWHREQLTKNKFVRSFSIKGKQYVN